MPSLAHVETPRLLTVAEVARSRRVPEDLRRRVAVGQLDAVRLGRGPKAPVRIDPEAVRDLLVEAGSTREGGQRR